MTIEPYQEDIIDTTSLKKFQVGNETIDVITSYTEF